MQLKFRGAEEDENSPNMPASSGNNNFYTDEAMHVALVGDRQNAHRSEIARYPLGLTERMIGREIDNRRIREEVAKLEAFHRRELEEEVITEMLIEREMISKGVPLLDKRREGFRTIGIGGIDGRFSLAGPMDNGGFEGFPLQPSKVVGKPIMELREEQEVSTVNVRAKDKGNCPSSPASSGNKTFYTDQPMHAALPVIRQNAHRSDITRYPSDLSEFLIGRGIKNRGIGEEMEKLEVFHQQKLEEQVIRGMRMGREISVPQAGLGLSYVGALLKPDVPGVPFLRRRDGFGTGIGFGTELEDGIDGQLLSAGLMDNGGFRDYPLQGQPRSGVDNGVSLKPIDLRKEQPDVPGVPLLSRRDGFGTGIRSGTGIGVGTELEHGIDGRLSSVGPMDNGGFEDFPLQGQPHSVVDNVVSLKPIIGLRKEQVVPMVNPSSSSVAGIKRRFEATVPEAVEFDTPLVNLRKKTRKELKCPLCQVTVSCEQTMKTHMNGKKHKAKERILLQGTSKDWQDSEDADVGVVELTKISDNTDASAHDMKERPRESNADSKPFVDESKNSQNDVDVGVLERTEILEKTSASTHDAKERPKESNADSKFYCRMCNFGTMSEEFMADHRMGGTHWNLLQENGGCVITIKHTPGNMQYAGEIEDTTAEGEADTAEDDRKGHQ